MKQLKINISELFNLVGIDHKGGIAIYHSDMTGLEPNPKDDWLYLGLLALKDIAESRKNKIHSAAFIGSGNGIETIAALKLMPELKKIFVTDLVQDIQKGIIKNIRTNAANDLKEVAISGLEGRDCQPLLEQVDLIYGNLPIIMCDPEEIKKHRLSMTTLTDAQSYEHLAVGHQDELRKWSMLSQLGFLLSAKDKLNKGGSILTFIGGRIPYQIINQCFKRAGLSYKRISTSFKRQSDSQFLRQYADYEAKAGVSFSFYDYQQAAQIIKSRLGVLVPDVINGLNDAELKELLVPALLTAAQAYKLSLTDQAVGHIAHAFEAWNPDNF
ncbi:MAG: hypothetical protein P4L74_02330 [Candidatus Doudnabacteria bacterium]|nr:hypothetical protein [Candidatus Doudnabacteria bacterium]